MQEKEHIINLLEQAQKATEKKDIVELKDLSNQTTHSASIYQDPDNIAIAVILYSLSKLIERKRYEEYADWPKFEKIYKTSIKNAIDDLRKDNLEAYRKHIEEIRTSVKKVSKNFQKHMNDVFRRALVSKASRLYEHGLSAEKTAKILGITLWELNQYIGKTGIADVNFAYTKDLNERIKIAEEIFKK